MKIDFLDHTSLRHSILRIFGTNVLEYKIFHDAVRQLANLELREVSLNELFGSHQPVTFLLRGSNREFGIKVDTSSKHFVWSMPASKWFLVEGLIEPFTESIAVGSFQWISGPEARYGLEQCDVPVLISFSQDGCW